MSKKGANIQPEICEYILNSFFGIQIVKVTVQSKSFNQRFNLKNRT